MLCSKTSYEIGRLGAAIYTSEEADSLKRLFINIYELEQDNIEEHLLINGVYEELENRGIYKPSDVNAIYDKIEKDLMKVKKVK